MYNSTQPIKADFNIPSVVKSILIKKFNTSVSLTYFQNGHHWHGFKYQIIIFYVISFHK